MSQHVRQTIAALESQAKHYEEAAQQARDTANRLRELLGAPSPAAPKARKSRRLKSTKPAKRTQQARARTTAKRDGAKPPLASFVHHYLLERAKAKTGPASTADILSGIKQLGYQFGSKSEENATHYLRKTLRVNKAFKRARRGQYVLA
jgi:hypothetical protein